MTTLASRKNGLSVCWPVGTPSAPGGHGKYEIKSVCVFFSILPHNGVQKCTQVWLMLHSHSFYSTGLWHRHQLRQRSTGHMLRLAHWLTTSPHILLRSLQRCRSRLSCCSLLSFIAWLTLFPFSSPFSVLNSFTSVTCTRSSPCLTRVAVTTKNLESS